MAISSKHKSNLQNALIKKPHARQKLSDQQVQEYVKCLDPEIGYLYWMTNFFYIQTTTKGKALFEPYDYQIRLLESYHKHTYNINMIFRQGGKTTCAAGYLLYHAMFHNDQTILIAAHKFTGAQEIMQRIRYAYETCPDYIRAGVVNYNKGSIEFDNGSRIISSTTTENTGRGMSISLLYCLDGDSTVRIRDKNTLVEEDISLAQLYNQLNVDNTPFSNNVSYDILTPDGWKDFKGVQLKGKKNTITLVTDEGNISATPDHSFFRHNEIIKTKDIQIGDYIDGISGLIQVHDIVHNDHVDVYDIIEVDHPKHQFIVNNSFITKNCDELAFLPVNIASEFWASISPTLSRGGRVIITSTPNSDEDQFAIMWKDANKKFDEYGNETALGINGFHAFRADWWEHPEQDEAWKQKQIGLLGDERFRREFGLEFLIEEETLINSITLSELEGIEPIMKVGSCRWYKQPSDNMIYVIALDPAIGTGGNNAAIQVFELPTMIQIAEWCHNTTAIEGQIRMLRDICKYIHDSCPRQQGSNIYWTVENNTVGESALLVIRSIGEDNIPGLFVSEPIRKGHVRKFRKGFNTTHKAKIAACSQLKHFIESKKMKILSKVLITELKAFIASGLSFKAKSGEYDDLISALLLIVRMSRVLADWDQRVFDIMNNNIDDSVEEWNMPMPIYISSSF